MIPKSISDIDNDWLIQIIRKLDPDFDKDKDFILATVHLSTVKCSDELFECCNVVFNYSEPKDVTHHWLIKLVPNDPDLREIVLRYDLFKKELLIHQQVIPELKEFVAKQGSDSPFGKLPARWRHIINKNRRCPKSQQVQSVECRT
jgi:hypothetical protein